MDMDQDDRMDFRALRAKFQEEELLLKQPKSKPALPEKPKVVPPPQSPPHYLPAGARPSLLTSINQTLDGKTMIAPRVVFKDDKKESKKPLFQATLKGKDKSEGKLKKSKDKTKGSKEKLHEEQSDQKQKKENGKKFTLLLPGLHKESSAELVPAMPPPKGTPTKKSFLGLRKSKKEAGEILADPILDSPSSEAPGQAPLIPVPSEFGDSPTEPKVSAPKALLPDIPALPDSSAAVEITPPSTIPASPDFTAPPAFIPDIPSPDVSTPESETQLEIETPAPPVSRPASQNEIRPPSAVPTPPVASTPSPSPPEPELAADAVMEAVNIIPVEKPPSLIVDPPSIPPSPKPERPTTALTALTALERAEDMKKTTPCDQRIFNALEKARKKTTSPRTSFTSSYSVTPPPEEFPPPQSSVLPIPELPPIDYEDRGGNALPKPAEVNGFDHRPSSPVLAGIIEEGGSDPAPELLVVPPPPPRKVFPDRASLGPPPEKPDRPPFVNLSEFTAPAPAPAPAPVVEENETPAPIDFSETDTTDIPEFDDVTSDTHSPDLPVSCWGNGEHTGPDTPDGQDLSDYYSNGIVTPGAEVPAAQDTPQPEASLSMSQESLPQAELQAAVDNGVYESTENVYEDIPTSATKKKGKTDGKKRKGPPKNPYAAEAPPQTVEGKTKTGRFGKSDKKAAAEGPDEKELKKKEKQRLEREKKELKEKQEKEKKEQKEREKKENEMKKKFKITGQEEAMYEAKVTVTTKGRKNDLPVKSGDNISIIRTTNCPKGKWLARDSSNNYGYVAVDHVELDIKEMLELGKKAAITRNSSTAVEPEVTSTGSRASNHYPLSGESYDSEEWTGDDDETLSPAPDTADTIALPISHTRTLSMPDMANRDLTVNHQHSQSADSSNVQARHEALQKLSTFFYSPKPVEPAASSTEPETSPVPVKEEPVQLPEQSSSTPDMDMLILPPPDLYADFSME
ncbi:histone-lysine N-methyltransferase 2D isoform X3 [Sparus aurata]|uniref:histone-lysine N-methyltransferase 2D isoform X3 n=1 Tax=Sparus aurata TaxID=8175 RepID=UPI0011C1AE33|nr:histone-lysine N-methyltransferase 2D-like isoform X3 [Sparus aurata]